MSLAVQHSLVEYVQQQQRGQQREQALAQSHREQTERAVAASANEQMQRAMAQSADEQFQADTLRAQEASLRELARQSTAMLPPQRPPPQQAQEAQQMFVDLTASPLEEVMIVDE